MKYSSEWIEILNEISVFQNDKSHTWFRGQSDFSFKLNSGLYRKNLNQASNYIATENTYYNVFNRLGYVHHKQHEWNLLFIMQHHGVRTRLLDWTESFAVALYFAIKNWNYTKDASVWMLDPLALNELTLGSGEAKFYTPKEDYSKYIDSESNVEFHDNTLAIYPIRNNNRLISQQGMFTLQGKANIPLEEEFDGKLHEKGILKKIAIKPTLLDDMKSYLKQNGINEFSLFPDLDGLANYVNGLGYFKERDN